MQEQQLDFTAYALKGTERVKLVIRRNNEKALKPTDGDTAYTETLSEGKNVFTLIAGTGTATVSESYTIYYDSQKKKLQVWSAETAEVEHTLRLPIQMAGIPFLCMQTGRHRLRLDLLIPMEIRAVIPGISNLTEPVRHHPIWRRLWNII